MPTVGIADLGSNTARLAVYDYEPGRWFRLVDGIREPIRLGEGLGRGNRLDPAAVKRALAAVELFSDYGEATGLDALEILGTSALRDAENGPEVVAELDRRGCAVDILSGEVEARLGVLGVANGFELADAWVVDLGGGSAQISQMVDRHYVSGNAYPLGAVRLTEAFLAADPPAGEEVRALEEAVENRLAGVVEEMEKLRLPLVAVGGTVRNLARMAQKADRYPLRVLHGYHLKRDALEEVTRCLLEAKLKRRKRMSGLNPDRADIVVAGALVFRWLLRRTGRDRLLISGHGIREGAFYRHLLPEPHLLEDVRRFAVDNLARFHPQPDRHVAQVRRLSGRLFDQLAPLHELPDGDRDLLDAAATLHDIGTTLDYYKHHKHGAYILTSAALHGFLHRDLALLALLVRYHRKGPPKLKSYRELMTASDRRRLTQLACCLRLAESMERSRAGRVGDVRVEIGKKKATLHLVPAAEEPFIEVWETRKHAPLFRRAFGRKLKVDSVAAAAAEPARVAG